MIDILPRKASPILNKKTNAKIPSAIAETIFFKKTNNWSTYSSPNPCYISEKIIIFRTQVFSLLISSCFSFVLIVYCLY